jgi:cytidyltransferase-like protein
MPSKKVFISGCFDMLHSGHVAFLNEAAKYGEVYVALGRDTTIEELKGRKTINSELERKYMLENLRAVKECFISKGSGILDFLSELDEIQPDYFIVNEDGNTPEKATLCTERGIEYVVLKREPYKELPRRSTTDLRLVNYLPYRIDIAGTWIDQPYVSKYSPGSAIVASLEPTTEFFERSGMATSTRNVARELWPMKMPLGKPEEQAKMLFRFDNPPGKKEISGSQDALGLMLPGINRIYYDKGEYWPSEIETIEDERIISFVEDHLWLLTLWPRKAGFNVLENTNITTSGVEKLAEAARNCWEAINNLDLDGFGRYFLNSFHAQISMFPNMINPDIENIIDRYKETASGWKLSGAGGGGYLILVSDKPIEGALKIKIRRKNF